jgi:hypothetical protein
MKKSRFDRRALFLLAITTLAACEPGTQQKAAWAEEERQRCLNSICPGDVWPTFDPSKEALMKIGGKWYLAPLEYGGTANQLAFLWPSKQPARMAQSLDGKKVPSSGGGYAQLVEVFLTSPPPTPVGATVIERAEKNGWVLERKELRRGLVQYDMKPAEGPDDVGRDRHRYFVATELRDASGNAPFAACEKGDVIVGRASAGFLWRHDIAVGVRMHRFHCTDWPEIYTEILIVLNQVKKL